MFGMHSFRCNLGSREEGGKKRRGQACVCQCVCVRVWWWGVFEAQAVCSLWVNSVPAAEVLYEREQSGGSCPSAEQLLFLWQAPFMDHRPGVGCWIHRPSSSSSPSKPPPPCITFSYPSSPKTIPSTLGSHNISTMPDEEWRRGMGWCVVLVFLSLSVQELSISLDISLMRYVKVHFTMKQTNKQKEVKQRVKTQAVETHVGTGGCVFTASSVKVDICVLFSRSQLCYEANS